MVIHRVWEKLWINLCKIHTHLAALILISGEIIAVNGKVIHREQNYSCVIRGASGKIATLCVAAIWLRSGGGADVTGVVGWGDGLLPISDLSGGYKHYLLLKRSLITDL